MKTLYKLGDIEQDEYITERADIHNKLEALKPSHIPEIEDAATVLEQAGTLLKRAKPEELEILFHSMLTTVYLHPDYPGYVVGIEPKPFLKELMDVAMLPVWKPPQAEDDDTDPDGSGSGGSTERNNGKFVLTENGGIMASVDAGEDHRVAVNGVIPVAPDLGTGSQFVRSYHIGRLLASRTSCGVDKRFSNGVIFSIPREREESKGEHRGGACEKTGRIVAFAGG